ALARDENEISRRIRLGLQISHLVLENNSEIKKEKEEEHFLNAHHLNDTCDVHRSHYPNMHVIEAIMVARMMRINNVLLVILSRGYENFTQANTVAWKSGGAVDSL
ncbi:hypothetical protein ACJX0J_015409, partial [Zea mays]